MRKTRRRTAMVVAFLALAAAGGGWYVTRGWPGSESAASDAAKSSSSVTTYAVPSDGPGLVPETDGAPASAHPGSGQTLATDEPPVVTEGVVPVVVSYSGWDPATRSVMVGGYVAGLVEGGGTCTLTLTRSGLTVEARSPAEPDAAAMACGGLTVPGAKLTPGTWEAVLSYSSASSHGEADSVAVEVPS